MHTSTLLTTLLTAALASGTTLNTNTKRGCFGGAGWGDSKDLAKNFAGSACANVFSKNDGGIQWHAGDTSQKCYNLDGDSKVDFSLEVNADAMLYANDCYNEFVKDIDGCDQSGGFHTYGAFTYRSDPNDGQCA